LGALTAGHESMEKQAIPYLGGPCFSDTMSCPYLSIPRQVLCFAKCQDALVGQTSAAHTSAGHQGLRLEVKVRLDLLM